MRALRFLAIASLLTTACGGGDDNNGGNGGPDATATDDSDTGEPQFEIGAGCISAADCGGGVCVDGKCCSSADAVCGGGCCASGTVCLFDKCVAPGGPCYTGNDCKTDEYCETALGGGAPSGDAGPPTDGGGMCLEPPPIPGKCVKRPAVCPDGMDAGGDCVPKCEYRPPVANLNAVIEWSWNATNAKEFSKFVDVWSTPTVGRIYDANCDGKVDQLDPPNVVFVAGKTLINEGTDTEIGTCCHCNGTTPTSCHTGVLRMLNGRTGKEIWSLSKASPLSVGFSGTSTAIGDLTGDGKMDIAAVTGEGYVVIVDATGKVVRTSDRPIPGGAVTDTSFGWGGGLAVADMDHDGFPEIAYGGTVFTTKDGKLTLLFGTSANAITDLSTFVDLDGASDGNLELLVGTRAVRADGTNLWNRTDITGSTFPAAADLNRDGKPEVVLVGTGKMYVLNGATGATIIGPFTIPGVGSGGPPTIADFDGDKLPEIGVAMQNFYSMIKPDMDAKTMKAVWSAPNHDLSSSVTGSSVFDFEGDGRAEVIYNDECFVWVYDGPTGKVRFAGLTTSFTGTEASVVADVDGDGRAEILMGSNRSDPSPTGSWKCNVAPWNTPDLANNRPAWKLPTGQKAYSGITVFGDSANAWVGTRTLWNEHTYHVSNICDDRDSACDAPNLYGSIPKTEKKNWTLPWLNNFRQNVQDKGIFDAPDATVSLAAKCTTPVMLEASLRNAGLASLPAGVEVGFYVGTPGTLLGKVKSTRALFPGQTEVLPFTAPTTATKSDSFYAKIEIDPMKPTFQQCRTDNDRSADVKPACPK